jgi:hypothetical protein
VNDQTPASAPVTAQDTPGGPGRQPDAPETAQTAPGGFPDVQGRCPACGGASLFVGSGGYITCRRIECPEPDAATTLLERNPRTTPDNSATSGDAADNLLREQIAEALAGHAGSKAFLADGTEWEHARAAWYAHADAVLPIIQDALRDQRDRQAEQSVALIQRYADLRITFRQALDAFEAYWARASYCGPGETAVQPEHLQAWRAVLDGKEQQ